MSVRKLRQQKSLSQERLAELTGLSLRTIQRVESGHSVGLSSWKALAEFFGVRVSYLKQNGEGLRDLALVKYGEGSPAIARHRAAQLVIFVITFFLCVFQWLAYRAGLSPTPADATLARIILVVAEIAFFASILAYLFNLAKVTFVWSYYTTVALFIVFALVIGYWTQTFGPAVSHSLLFPVYFSLMLLCLSVLHVLQLALSLQGERTVLVRN